MKKILLVLTVLALLPLAAIAARDNIPMIVKTRDEEKLEKEFIQRSGKIDKEYREKQANLMKEKMHPDILNALKRHELEWYEFQKEMNEAEFEIKMNHLQELQKIQQAIDASKLMNQRQ